MSMDESLNFLIFINSHVNFGEILVLRITVSFYICPLLHGKGGMKSRTTTKIMSRRK